MVQFGEKNKVADKLINITLPDGTVLNKPIGTTGYDIAFGISESLAKQSIAVEIDDEVKDLSYPMENDCALKILKKAADFALALIRHD